MRGQRLIFIVLAIIVIATLVLQTCMVAGPPVPVTFRLNETGPVATGPVALSTASPSPPVETVTAMDTATAVPLPASTVATTPVTTPTTPPPLPTEAPPTPSPTAAVALDTAIPTPPDRDLNDLTRRYHTTTQSLPTPATHTPTPRQVGSVERFWIADQAQRVNFEIDATLVAMSPHAYMYVQNGARASDDGIQAALDFFEQETYPRLTSIFRPNWRPRINGDERVTILNAHIPGVGGYFSTADQYPRSVNPHSNEREMIYMNVAGLEIGSPPYHATLAHEYTHLLQWHLDDGDESWVNEGSAEIGAEMIGAAPSGSVRVFLSNPDLQLTAWQDSANASIAHYGAAYLFFRYLADHFGGFDAIGRLIGDPEDGIAGIEHLLAATRPEVAFDDVFADWVVANYLNDPNVEDGRYSYQLPYGLRVRAEPGPPVGGELPSNVSQFGARYFEIDLPPEDVRLTFSGVPHVPLVPVDAKSGRFQWWSNRGDAINTRLTRRVDLSEAKQPRLRFSTWYDIEPDYDYAYVAASTDGGNTWQTLPARTTTTSNPNGNSLGHAFTGRSGGGPEPEWVEEEIDLTPLAGKEVLLRFEYVTDDAYNANGIGLDDLRIEEIGWFDDGETDGDWNAEGFTRVTNRAPARYAVKVIELGGTTHVHHLTPDQNGSATISLPGRDRDGNRAVVVVAGLTRHTLQRSDFTISLERE